MIDISSLFPDFEALTPEGRWNALQDWLKKNPEYGERVARWSRQSVDQVFDEICDLAAKKYKLPVVAIKAVLGIEMQRKLKSTIVTLQTLYRERQEQEQETKNVRTTRQVDRGSGQNPRRVNARTKRTDQT